MDKTKTTVIVPAYNEEKRIAPCLCELNSVLSVFYDEIIVACEGSTDHTEKLARIFGADISTGPERLGKGGGFWKAFNMSRGSNIVLYDPDMSVAPERIRDFVGELSFCDVVVARRLRHDFLSLRRFLSVCFAWLVHRMFRLNVKDTQCGFKAFRRNVLESIQDEATVKGWAFDVEILVKAQKKGFKLREVPVEWKQVKDSKVNPWKTGWRMLRELLGLWWRERKTK